MSMAAGKGQQEQHDHRWKAEGDIAEMLDWYAGDKLSRGSRLGGQEYEGVFPGEVPGYEDEPRAILLRRRGDGVIYEVSIDVTLHRVDDATSGTDG